MQNHELNRMKKLSYLLLLLFAAVACKKLTSEEYALNNHCSTFSHALIDSLKQEKIAGLHYIFVDTTNCVLTVKFEKEKLKP